MPYQISGANLYRDASNFAMRCCTAPGVVYMPCTMSTACSRQLAQTVIMLMATGTTKRVRGPDEDLASALIGKQWKFVTQPTLPSPTSEARADYNIVRGRL